MTGSEQPSDLPGVGALALDTKRNKLGEVMARTHGCVWLRPARGGIEWTAKPADVECVDELRMRLAEVNARSQQAP